MLISNDKAHIEHALFLATQARDKALHYQHSQLGFNYRLSNISAGIGRGQMEVLDQRIERRREILTDIIKNLVISMVSISNLNCQILNQIVG